MSFYCGCVSLLWVCPFIVGVSLDYGVCIIIVSFICCLATLIDLLREVLDAKQSLFNHRIKSIEDSLQKYLKVLI